MEMGRRSMNTADQGRTKNEGSRLIFWPVAVAGTGLLFLGVQSFGVEYPWLRSDAPVNPVSR